MAVTDVTADTFEAEVLRAEQPVLVDFYADWCRNCRQMAPFAEQIAEERPDVKICRVNIETDRSIADAYSVKSIPTFIVFRNGSAKNRIVGTKPKGSLLALLR